MFKLFPRFLVMRIFLTGVCLLYFFVGQAQNLTVLDSLRKELRAATPERKFQLLNAIGFEYRYSYPDSTIAYCLRAYDLGKSLHLPHELSKPLSFMGLAYSNKGDYKQSLDYHYQSIEVATEQNDSVQLAYAYNNLGRMFFDEGDQARAYDNLVRSKELFEILKDKSGLAYVYRSLANVYKSQNELIKAIEMSTRALELRKELGNPRDLASAYMELGLVYHAMKEPQVALAKLRLADSTEAKVNDKVTKAEIRLGIAEILMEQRQYRQAFDAALEVLRFVSASTNRKLFLRSSMIEGKYFAQVGQDAKAISILERIVSDENSVLPYFQRDAAYELYIIYDRQRDGTHAEEYHNRYRILAEKLENQELTNQIERLLFQIQIEKKEKENEALKTHQLENDALILKQRWQNRLLLLILLSLAGIAALAWIAGRRRRKINSQLVEQNQQIEFQREEISHQNEKLSRRNHELSELNNEKDTLMNIVAHDLKSPLNSISGLVRVLEAEGELPEHHKEVMNLIKKSTRAGLEMITDLLDVNALEAGSNPHYTSFNLGELLEERIASFRILANTKSIALSFENAINGSIVSDPDYCVRILDNLASNAIKFSPRSSSVSVRAKPAEGGITISIRDEGPGFSDVDRALAFQKFKKLSARPTGGETSNGLGLAIVKTLVDRLGGSIELISEPDRGSEFTVFIPDQEGKRHS